MIILDCTLRDGGYYNDWNFPKDRVNEYLNAMAACGVDIVELGLRSTINGGFKGAYSYSTDRFLSTLDIPKDLKVGVMVNASELIGEVGLEEVLSELFPEDASTSPVDLVRIACHVHEFESALPASGWLKERGYLVGFNLMQVAERSQKEIEQLSEKARRYPLDVLYFADSMGSMTPSQTAEIIGWLRKSWDGDIGIHTHDNMGLALQNTLGAFASGVTWLDATVTGMGRGPGNARTEELVIEASDIRNDSANIVPLMTLIREYFHPLKNKCGWGSNPYYYLAGKYGIHPTYIQTMLGDSRYSEEDILSTIDHLRREGGKKFSFDTLDASREFFQGEPRGTWNAEELFAGREVLLLGTGPSVEEHKGAIETYIKLRQPVVVALNTQSSISQDLIDVRIACHPTRLLADCARHVELPQPLITPASMLPDDVRDALRGKVLFDYGVSVKADSFEFGKSFSVLPNTLVVSYALSAITAGKAEKILMAGFDGYEADDPRNHEINNLIKLYELSTGSLELLSITPSRYDVCKKSIYGLI